MRNIDTEYLLFAIKFSGLSKYNFAEKCKITVQTLNKILDNKKVGLVSILKISQFLKVDLSQMFIEN